jgi:hypothetical protein
MDICDIRNVPFYDQERLRHVNLLVLLLGAR